MARMRIIPEAIRHIKSTDPDTAITPHALRMLILSDKFPHVPIGNKRLVDVDLLERFLSGEYVPPEKMPGYGTVQRTVGECLAITKTSCKS